MRKDILRRLKRLEQRIGPEEWPLYVVILASDPEEADPIGAKEPASLGPDERIVVDWIRNDEPYVLARERITSDPSDMGRRCARNGCLEDVVREFHEKCSYRHRGTCRVCSGLGLFPEPQMA